MENKTSILLIEDNPGDARLFREMLKEEYGEKLVLQHADRVQVGLEHFEKSNPAVILLDLHLPDSQGLDTFIKVHKHASRVPIVVLTGLNDKDLALQAVRNGAQDYLVKGEITTILLVRSLNYAIERHKLRNELHSALEQIKTLKGLLPICMYCKKIRDDKQYWQQIEGYISEHSDAQFSHGICPACYKKHVQPDLDKIENKNAQKSA